MDSSSENAIVDLIGKLTRALNNIDVYVVECSPFVYQTDKIYKTVDELKVDVKSGKANMYFEVQAMLGGNVWGFLD